MSSVYTPVAEAVIEARRDGRSLRPQGADTHAALCVSATNSALEMRGFDKVIEHSPAELMLSVQAGTSLHDIEELLAVHKQRLSCAFRNLSGLYTAYSPHRTIGGAISVGLSGSDRVNHYAVRDALLGLTAINGHAEEVIAGGRVFKNVTGYDWGKLMIGAMGSFGAIMQVQMRLRPAAQDEVTLNGICASYDEAVELMAKALNSGYDVSGAASVQDQGGLKVYLRLEGDKASVQERLLSLKNLINLAEPTVMSHEESRRWWRDMNDIRMWDQAMDTRNIWLFSQPQSVVSSLGDRLNELDPNASCALDWGGAQLWWATDHNFTIEQLAEKVPTEVSIRPIRQRERGQYQLLTPSVVEKKILKKLYLNIDPDGVFSPLNPYALKVDS